MRYYCRIKMLEPISITDKTAVTKVTKNIYKIFDSITLKLGFGHRGYKYLDVYCYESNNSFEDMKEEIKMLLDKYCSVNIEKAVIELETFDNRPNIFLG